MPPDLSTRVAVPGGTAEAIRAAAVRLFADHGYEATTMNDIGRSVGIGGSALYNHVPSKQELLRDIMLSAMQELIDVVSTAVESTESIPEKLQVGVRHHVTYHAHRRLEFSIGNREIPSLEEPARSEIVDLRRRYVELFQGIIDAGIAADIFSVESSLIATHSILQSGMGVAVWYHPDGPMRDTDLGAIYGEFALRIVGFRR